MNTAWRRCRAHCRYYRVSRYMCRYRYCFSNFRCRTTL